MAKISIVRGKDRKENITKAISLLEEDINKAISIKNKEQLFIKINAIDTNFPLACTHIDALEAVLNQFYNKFNDIIIGDNTFVFTKNKGGSYQEILKKFPKVKLSDLTEFESEDIEFENLNSKTSPAKISLLPRKAFTISLALPKTHDAFVYTGCLKNMFGCVIKNRSSLHASNLYERLNLNKYIKGNMLKWHNLVKVINKLKPDLSILDAYECMEGNGPLFGTKVKLELALCSLDGLALDKLASKILGFNHVPYLSLLPDSNINIIKEGFNKFSEINKNLKTHYNYKYQTMTNTNSSIPKFDIKLAMSILKRSYRLKDKIFEKLNS